MPASSTLTVPAGVMLPDAVRELLEAYGREHGVAVRVWTDGGADPVLAFPQDGSSYALTESEAAPIEGTDLRIEVVGQSRGRSGASARFLASAAGQLLKHKSEIDFFSREMTERYEEINLLYSISETLGAVISLEEGGGTILEEVVGTLSASRATLWVYVPEHEQLRLAATVGGVGQIDSVPIADPCSVTAHVFREQRAVLLAPDEAFPRPGCEPLAIQPSSLLSVPVSYTPPQGEARTVGVINLVGRGRQEFSASDLKLLSAIASQIGAAVENSRLVASSVQQERVMREMELAHDLQLKLLPSVESFAGYADVAARCAPAHSVGGDFYHLFQLGRGRIGVMIGDVSGHGFGAALIMALTMSAVAIHASEGDSPAEVLRRVHRALISELESTGMYMTLFYGVIDARAGTLTYANAGHAHAFRIPASGEPERLGATNPPFGIVDLDGYAEASTGWEGGQDLLFLFTDGLSDAVGAGEIAGSQMLLNEVIGGREQSTEQLLDRLFEVGSGDGNAPPDDRTAVLVRI